MNTIGELRQLPTPLAKRPLPSSGEQTTARPEPQDLVSSGPELRPTPKTPVVPGALTLRVAELALAMAMDPTTAMAGSLFAPSLRSNAESGVLAVTRHSTLSTSTQYSLPDGTDVFQTRGLKPDGDVSLATSAQRSEMKVGTDGMLVNHITLLKTNVNGDHIEVTNPDGTLTMLNTRDLALESSGLKQN